MTNDPTSGKLTGIVKVTLVQSSSSWFRIELADESGRISMMVFGHFNVAEAVNTLIQVRCLGLGANVKL